MLAFIFLWDWLPQSYILPAFILSIHQFFIYPFNGRTISFNVDSSIKCQKPQIIDRTKERIRLWEQLAEEQKQKNKDRLARFDPFAFIEHLEECPW